ncbi:MAG: putative phthalate 4,5-dioxygenase oxygenase subunit [Rhodopila sp.]|jgi:phthalate 4,5-dioxygenase oxygenase subunit|nr:putative phthalate 4,5-dioxygenase oxygenase subunit [Rhodopila sp.]
MDAKAGMPTEHLCTSDAGIVMTRRLLLDSAADYEQRGIKPLGVGDPEVLMVRAVSLTLPEGTGWAEAGHPFMKAQPGTDFGYRL